MTPDLPAEEPPSVKGRDGATLTSGPRQQCTRVRAGQGASIPVSKHNSATQLLKKDEGEVMQHIRPSDLQVMFAEGHTDKNLHYFNLRSKNLEMTQYKSNLEFNLLLAELLKSSSHLVPEPRPLCLELAFYFRGFN